METVSDMQRGIYKNGSIETESGFGAKVIPVGTFSDRKGGEIAAEVKRERADEIYARTREKRQGEGHPS